MSTTSGSSFWLASLGPNLESIVSEKVFTAPEMSNERLAQLSVSVDCGKGGSMLTPGHAV